ncbi:hypothetical protein WJX74_005756 [Apatococcus lobatus]|uniref:Ankyrin repeat protein n=1 Tax=Apatococcus lobatus TaxID=904363 RepID=A0AAW1QTH0_9CHLO
MKFETIFKKLARVMQQDRKKACLDWLLQAGPVNLLWTPSLSDTCCKAAAEGRIEVLSYLLEVACFPDGDDWTPQAFVCAAAARHGQIQVLTWLWSRTECDVWTASVCNAAVKAHQLEVLCWLRTVCQPPCECTAQTLSIAASQGRLDMVQLLRAGGCPWNTDCMTSATSAGDLGMMQWMREQDPPCPWSPACMKAAAQNGHLHLMQWMRAQDPPCPWDETCIRSAMRFGSLCIIQWLCQQSCPWHTSCVWDIVAAGSESVDIVEWMHSQPLELAPWEPRFSLGCAAAGGLPMLQWLHKAGYQLDADTAWYAAQRGHLRVAHWLLSSGLDAPSPQCAWLSDYFSVPTLLLWGQHDMPLFAHSRKRLQLARATFCTLHGLIRWCRKQMPHSSIKLEGSEPTLTKSPFPFSSSSRPAQQLLVNIAMLPHEIFVKIAVAAELQFDPAVTVSRTC